MKRIPSDSIAPVTTVPDALNQLRNRIRRYVVLQGSALVLVVLVVFEFLRNVRATVIPALAVPLSLLGTFGVNDNDQ